MLDHVTIGTSNLARAMEFYDRALKPLGIERLFADGETASGYGMGKRAFFWIGTRDAVITGTHVAFAAPDHATVDAFHAAAVAAGPDGGCARGSGFPDGDARHRQHGVRAGCGPGSGRGAYRRMGN